MGCGSSERRQQSYLDNAFSYGFLFAGVVGELDRHLERKATTFESIKKLADELTPYGTTDERFWATAKVGEGFPYFDAWETLIGTTDKELANLPEVGLELHLLRLELEHISTLPAGRVRSIKYFCERMADKAIGRVSRVARSPPPYNHPFRHDLVA